MYIWMKWNEWSIWMILSQSASSFEWVKWAMYVYIWIEMEGENWMNWMISETFFFCCSCFFFLLCFVLAFCFLGMVKNQRNLWIFLKGSRVQILLASPFTLHTHTHTHTHILWLGTQVSSPLGLSCNSLKLVLHWVSPVIVSS